MHRKKSLRKLLRKSLRKKSLRKQSSRKQSFRKKSLRTKKYDGAKQCPKCKVFNSNEWCMECMVELREVVDPTTLTDEEQMNFAIQKSLEESMKSTPSPLPTPTDFHIYTTGILDTGKFYSIINAWRTMIWHRIIDKISSYYKSIYFHHYDMHPLGDIGKLVTKQLCIDDEKPSIVKKSSFYNEQLNIDKINNYNHLIVDFAHIFKYTRKGPVLNESTLDFYETKYDNKIPKIKLNVIYFGYIGEYQVVDSGFSSYYIAENDLIHIDKEGKITTYIDKLLLFTTSEIIYPEAEIEEMFNRVRKQVIENIIKIDKRKAIFDLVFNRNKSETLVTAIIHQIMTSPKPPNLNDIITDHFRY